jgi:hypothetical protein
MTIEQWRDKWYAHEDHKKINWDKFFQEYLRLFGGSKEKDAESALAIMLHTCLPTGSADWIAITGLVCRPSEAMLALVPGFQFQDNTKSMVIRDTVDVIMSESQRRWKSERTDDNTFSLFRWLWLVAVESGLVDEDIDYLFDVVTDGLDTYVILDTLYLVYHGQSLYLQALSYQLKRVNGDDHKKWLAYTQACRRLAINRSPVDYPVLGEFQVLQDFCHRMYRQSLGEGVENKPK